METKVEPKTAVRLEIENLELLATVESQEDLINAMKEELRKTGGYSDRRSEIQALGQKQVLMDKEQALKSKDLTIQQLKEELASSQRAVEDVYRKYEQNRKKSDSRENTIRKMQKDMQNLQETLESAQKEKLDIADKMRQVQNDKASLKLDFDWMRQKIQSYEGDPGDKPGVDEQDSGYRSKTGGYHSTKTKSVRKYESTSDGDRQFSTTVQDYYSSSSDDKNMQPVVKHFRDVEGSFRRAVSSSNQELNREKDELMREFKHLQTQLNDLQREHESYAQKVAEKDDLIERLKTAKTMLENDLDTLITEMQELKQSCEKLQTENSDLQSNLIRSKNQVSKLEVEYENEVKQKNYLKDAQISKVEQDLQTTIKSHNLDKDERIDQIKAQLQQERVESRREIQEKINEIESLMTQINNLETEVDRLRSQLSSLQTKCTQYEVEIRSLQDGGAAGAVEEERATTTLVMETQARPDEKHVSTSEFFVAPRESSTLLVGVGPKEEKQKQYSSSFYRSTASFPTTRDLGAVDIVVTGVSGVSEGASQGAQGSQSSSTRSSNISKTEISETRNITTGQRGQVEVQLQGSLRTSQTKDNEEAVETMKGYSSQQTLDDGDDELKRIIEESRSRRRRMKEEMFSNP